MWSSVNKRKRFSLSDASLSYSISAVALVYSCLSKTAVFCWRYCQICHAFHAYWFASTVSLHVAHIINKTYRRQIETCCEMTTPCLLCMSFSFLILERVEIVFEIWKFWFPSEEWQKFFCTLVFLALVQPIVSFSLQIILCCFGK